MSIHPDDIQRVKGQGFLRNKGTDCFNARILTTNGNVSTDQIRAIAEAADRFGSGRVQFTSRMTVELPGIPYEKIGEFQAFLAEYGLYTGGTGPKVRPVVSCKGTTCQYGLYDTFGLSEKIHERFYLGYHDVKLPHKFKIAAGGCPNNCVKPDLNDLGVIGQRIKEIDFEKCRGCRKCKISEGCPMKAASVQEGRVVIDETVCNNCGRCAGKCPFGAFGEGKQAWKVCIGGRWGKRVAHGIPLNRIFTSEEEVLEVIERTIHLFRDEGISGERLSDTVSRLGFEYVQEKLLSGLK